MEARLGALSTASALIYRFFGTAVSPWTDLGAQMGPPKWGWESQEIIADSILVPMGSQGAFEGTHGPLK